jgi:formate hydrogenlyase subunit 3/multisubunit Na+/H+ antiporter MnhD subunit
MARKFPIASIGVILAHFSIAGVPLLAGFPVYFMLWEQLSIAGSNAALWTLFGSVGLIAGGVRSLAVLIMGPEELPWAQDQSEGMLSRVLLLAGVGILFVVGLFPQWFLPLLFTLSAGSENIAP